MVKKMPMPAPKAMPLNPTLAADESLKMLVNAWANYKNTVEVETTKRASIQAWRDTRLAELDNQRKILENYLSNTFKERSEMISGFFSALDKGIESGDSSLINSSIGAILSVAKESPLAQAKEILMAMNDPKVGFIEI